MTTRSAVLHALRETSDAVTVADLAEALTLPPTTVRFHLHSLTDDGLADSRTDTADGPGRPRIRYRARPAMDPTGSREYGILSQALIAALTSSPDGTQRADDAGRALGADRADPSTDAGADLLHVLDGLGFDPVADTPSQTRLRRCPFLESARASPQITCSVHRGLMQGVLDAHGVHTRVTLDAFVDGDHCVARLAG